MISEEERKVKNSEKQKRWARNNPEKHHVMVKKWEQDNPERAREMHRKSLKKLRAKLRQEAITLLGGQCVQCQCNDIRCLQIDHVLPCKGKRLVTYQFYRSIIQGQTDNLQVLCANCHAIKTYCEYEQ
jgi:hypothetical protein